MKISSRKPASANGTVLGVPRFSNFSIGPIPLPFPPRRKISVDRLRYGKIARKKQTFSSIIRAYVYEIVRVDKVKGNYTRVSRTRQKDNAPCTQRLFNTRESYFLNDIIRRHFVTLSRNETLVEEHRDTRE